MSELTLVRGRWSVGLVVSLAAGALLSCSGTMPPSTTVETLQQGSGAIRSAKFVGLAQLPRGVKAGGWPVGGLSGIAWDQRGGFLWAISDDRSQEGPARLVKLDFDEAALALRVREAVPLTRLDASPYPAGSIDGEGLALTPEGTLLVSSEGDASKSIQPFVREVDAEGHHVQEFPLPPEYLLDGTGKVGVRDNLGFEGLTLSVDGREVLLATENALTQDGPRAGLGVGSPVRLLRLDRSTGEPIAQHLYLTEPIAAAPRPRGGFAVNGVSSILALDGRRILVLERSFSDGVGVTVRLFEADLDGATDVSAFPSLDGANVTPIAKRLLFDFGSLGVPLDNYEGLAWGAPRADGSRTLLVVSDDNFSLLQRTQVAVFALELAPPTVADVQGRGARSPLEGQCLTSLDGVVTASRPDRREPGFWLADPAGRGVFVDAGEFPLPAAGARVRVAGCIEERRRAESDPYRTVIALGRAPEVLGTASKTRPVLIGAGGLEPPRGVVDDDFGRDFDPKNDALDFWSALEGSLVTIRDPLVVGPLDEFGQIAVVGGGGVASGPRTPRGGLLGIETDVHAERVVLAPLPGGALPPARVGDRLAPVTGIVEFRWGSWRVVAVEAVEIAARADWALLAAREGGSFSIASYNTLNLSYLASKERFDALARSIVEDLGAPAVVALQEIQDDSGSADDATTTAALGLGRLVDAVIHSGGPRYRPLALDPGDKQDGGQPGGNIRVALLVDETRARVIERQLPGAVVPIGLEGGGAGPSASPGRLFVDHAAFGNDGGEGGTRKPLVVELEVAGERLVVVVCHLASKSGDDPVLGARQPPLRHSDARRLRQARALADWVDQLVALDPEAEIVVVGDFNDVPWRPAIRLLAEGGTLVHLQPEDPAAAYTFNWQGVSDWLDHAFVSRTLADRRKPRLEIVHRNVDLPAAQAVSDHDPILVVFDRSR